MIVVLTAMLVLMLLMFAPIRFQADVKLYFRRLSAEITAKSLAMRVLDETIYLRGRYLVCRGTVSTDLDIGSVDKKGGVDLLQCVTIDKLRASLDCCITEISMLQIAFYNAFAALATATLCNLFHCQFYSRVQGTLRESSLLVSVVACTSVAELSFCLIKQGVRQWKIRKLKK